MSRRKSSAERISYLLNLLMAGMYAAGGLTLFFWKRPSMSDKDRYLLGGVLLAYAVYRFIKLHMRNKNAQNEN